MDTYAYFHYNKTIDFCPVSIDLSRFWTLQRTTLYFYIYSIVINNMSNNVENFLYLQINTANILWLCSAVWKKQKKSVKCN